MTTHTSSCSDQGCGLWSSCKDELTPEFPLFVSMALAPKLCFLEHGSGSGAVFFMTWLRLCFYTLTISVFLVSL